MLIKKPADISSAEITPKHLYLNRRNFLLGAGALAGAALGSAAGHMGTGAAIGAGTGLVAGSAVGSGNARAAGGSLQARYDTVYAQCMTAKGNRIPGPPVVEPVYVYPHPYY